MEVEKIINYFIDSDNNEITDPEENGRAVVFNGVAFREGEKIQVTIESGQVYSGILVKVSTLSPSSKKDLKITDLENVSHLIKYDLIKENGIVKLQEQAEEL